MCPYSYYTTMRESKEPRHLRLKMVRYARQHGVKPAARAFHATPKTVRKWLRRFDASLDSLADHSRAPYHSPRKLPAQDEARIQTPQARLPPPLR